MIHLLLALALGATPVAAQAAPPTAQAAPPAAQSRPAELWRRSATRIASVPARIAFPLTAGPMALTEQRELSHPGEGIDATLQYQSPDGAVIGTIYVYHPGLAHAGLAALATDRGIRANSNTPVRAGPSTVVAAGGKPGIAIRTDYANYRGGRESSAAFIKAGRWMLKLRVTAPEKRMADVEAGMSALLRGIEFGAENTPRPATVLNPSPCPRSSGAAAATPLPDAQGPDLVALAMLGTFDAAGIEGTDERGARKDVPSRIPANLCLSRLVAMSGGEVPILRSADGSSGFVDGRTRLLVLLSDAGEALEIVHAPNFKRHVLLHHLMGETRILGSFDGVPSDDQMRELLTSGGSALKLRAFVRFRPGRGAEVNVPASPAPGPAPTS